MATGDRFYMLELRHRPAVYGDLGNLIKIDGLVVGGEGAQTVLLLPGTLWTATQGHTLTMEEWTDFLARTDNPEILVGPAKAFHRKVRYEISGAVQQKVWVADGCKCMFCGVAMGRSPLSIDHYFPLEMGGKNDTSNFLSACRGCNKKKGAQDPVEYCRKFKTSMTHEEYVSYLATRKLP